MITIIIAIIVLLIIVGMGTVFTARFTELESRITDLERRIENVADAGKTVNRELRATQAQVDDAIKRARL